MVRNWHAVNAHFRKSGPMGNKRTEVKERESKKDTLEQLAELLDEAGIKLYLHKPGCGMQDCSCSKQIEDKDGTDTPDSK